MPLKIGLVIIGLSLLMSAVAICDDGIRYEIEANKIQKISISTVHGDWHVGIQFKGVYKDELEKLTRENIGQTLIFVHRKHVLISVKIQGMVDSGTLIIGKLSSPRCAIKLVKELLLDNE